MRIQHGGQTTKSNNAVDGAGALTRTVRNRDRVRAGFRMIETLNAQARAALRRGDWDKAFEYLKQIEKESGDLGKLLDPPKNDTERQLLRRARNIGGMARQARESMLRQDDKGAHVWMGAIRRMLGLVDRIRY